jgi:hypothetical protein
MHQKEAKYSYPHEDIRLKRIYNNIHYILSLFLYIYVCVCVCMCVCVCVCVCVYVCMCVCPTIAEYLPSWATGIDWTSEPLRCRHHFILHVNGFNNVSQQQVTEGETRGPFYLVFCFWNASSVITSSKYLILNISKLNVRPAQNKRYALVGQLIFWSDVWLTRISSKHRPFFEVNQARTYPTRTVCRIYKQIPSTKVSYQFIIFRSLVIYLNNMHSKVRILMSRWQL